MKTLQFVGDTTAKNDSFVGAERMLTVDKERWELRLHDNETPGGHRILNLEQLKLIFMQLTSEFGAVAFSPDARGFLVRVGNKQYALRKFLEGTGIGLTNPDGVDGDVTIGIDTDWLNSLAFTASNIAYGGETGGVAGAFTLTLPDNWPDTNGSCAFFSFHVAPEDGATLSINNKTSLPLLTPRGGSLLSQVAGIHTRALLIRNGGGYYLIGLQPAVEVGISPIAGLAATNVQEALAALRASIAGIGPAPSTGVFYTFANHGQVPTRGPSISYLIPLASGQRRLVSMQTEIQGVSGGGGSSTGTSIGGIHTTFGINGVSVVPAVTGGTVGGFPSSLISTAWGILSRNGDAIRFAQQALPFHWAADTKVFSGTDYNCGSVASGATTVAISIAGLPQIRFSDNGVAV